MTNHYPVETSDLGPIRRCSKCGHSKPHTIEFFTKSRGKPGASCRDCELIRGRKKNQAEYTRKIAEGHGPELAEKARKQYHTKKGKLAARIRGLRSFGLTLESYTSMLAEQGNSCAICKSSTPGGRGSFHVDHCHSTGRVRGLLCHSCNTSLGGFKDDARLLRSALEYLEATNG